MTATVLDIKDLNVVVDNKNILNGIDLKIQEGMVVALMGPNGAGKSTLSNVLAGRGGYNITSGAASFYNKDLLSMSPEERAKEGLFLAFQYPIEIPGVPNTTFLRSALNAQRASRGEKLLDAIEFLSLAKKVAASIEMDEKYLNRPVNVGFSGGEKKRNEVFQLLMMDPKLAIMDETDSGLDIDALQIVSKGINQFRNKKRTIVIITHYQRLLEYIVPDIVHILYEGKVVKSGDAKLAMEIEKNGYTGITEAA